MAPRIIRRKLHIRREPNNKGCYLRRTTLVVTEWGDELCDFVFRASRMTTTIFNFYDPRLGLKGEFLDVLISRKASAADLVTEPGSHRDWGGDIMSPPRSESFQGLRLAAIAINHFTCIPRTRVCSKRFTSIRHRRNPNSGSLRAYLRCNPFVGDGQSVLQPDRGFPAQSLA